ncbi:hypothetical protein [Myxococcus sp. RHSTA-1-4]|uniref:hypothetical protein n=1 Tax=Myxococcus sp. RHSTA-1-4 TaxID=2874601 RepID=UPI001CBE83BE|nr:hypothetical protein [Myxococcus sp. RHSTA-1-4]
MKLHWHTAFVGRQQAASPGEQWSLKQPVGFVAEPPAHFALRIASAPDFVQAQSELPSQKSSPGVQMGAPSEPGSPLGPCGPAGP